MIDITISITCFNKVNMTKQCCAFLDQNTPRDNVEYIFSDNCSSDNTYHYLTNECPLPNVTVIAYGENLGFQIPHNEALRMAQGRMFIVLNNDIYIKDPDWLEKLLTPLMENESIALTGLLGNPCALSSEGKGVMGHVQEYVEGSCIAGRTALLRKYGLFSPAFDKFFYEDSDLSLRYRQMGYQIQLVKIPFEHVRGVTVNSVNANIINQSKDHNRRIFISRWDSYLRNRQFTNRVLVKVISAGIGDVIAVTPVLKGLRMDHPTAEIVVETSAPEVFENNDYITKVCKKGGADKLVYDRVVDLMPPPNIKPRLNFAAIETLCEGSEWLACTKVFDHKPQLFLTRYELDEGARILREIGKEAKIVGLSPFSHHYKAWHGRSWVRSEAVRLVKMLQHEGFKVVEFGKDVESTGEADLDLVDQLSIREFFAVIENLDKHLYITIDSIGLHVAQAFGVPTLALMGAVEPVSRVLDFTTVGVIRDEGLHCLGCYQKKGDPGMNKCEYDTESCMKNINADLVMAYVTGDIDFLESNILYLKNGLKEGLKRRR